MLVYGGTNGESALSRKLYYALNDIVYGWMDLINYKSFVLSWILTKMHEMI